MKPCVEISLWLTTVGSTSDRTPEPIERAIFKRGLAGCEHVPAHAYAKFTCWVFHRTQASYSTTSIISESQYPLTRLELPSLMTRLTRRTHTGTQGLEHVERHDFGVNFS